MPEPNGHYSFLPYLRQGLATKQPTPDTYIDLSSPGGAARGQFGLALTIEKTDANTSQVVSAPVSNTVLLKGPADIIGINSNAIVKTFPSDWVTNFEPNYLPYIEFYDEDFLWHYTPAAVRREGTTAFKYRIRPWITLIVLKEDEFTDVAPFNGILPAISVANPSAAFPKANDLWAWGHVHVNGNLSPNGNGKINRTSAQMNAALAKMKTLLEQNPDKSVSRLLSSRKLEPNTGYHAFVIPTFENGRRAGLGISGMVSKLKPAWDGALSTETQFPVYKRWYFKTGGAGDFESLVRLLQPRILDNSVGKRQVDLTHSNNPELEAVTPPVSTLGLQSVIQPTDAEADTWSLNNVYAKKIKDIVNAPAVIMDEEGGDPVISPPLYGCWHAAQNTVTTPGSAVPTWIQEANLDPRYRLFAGAGAEVLRRNQDKYMAIAWKQVGEVIKANKKIRLMQLAKRANIALHKKHLKSLNDELLLNISGPVHERVLGTTANETIYKNISESAIPNSMLSAAFRRLTRPGGPLVSNINFTTGNQVSTTELIADVNSGAVQPTQPVQAPPGQISYTIWSPSQLTPAFTTSLPTNSGFAFSNPGIYNGTPTPGPNAPQTQIFVNTVADLHALITSLPGYSFNTLPSLQLPTTSSIILQRTDPVTNSLAFINRSLSIKAINNAINPIDDLDVVLAAPRIRTTMLTELAALSPDWIMPGLNDVGNNTISILEANQKYVEAFMLGLNHAMAGELLWRGYPTDQRGTTFSYFWGYNNSMAVLQTVSGNDQVANLGNYRDIQDIHLWKNANGLKALGKNSARAGMNSPNMLVLVIRGELLRKYPGSVIYLQKAKWKTTTGGTPITTEAREIDSNSVPKYPAFSANVGQDIYFLGFSGVTAEDVRGGGLDDTSRPGYFVIFQERAGNLKFGADIYDTVKHGDPADTSLSTWDDVNWGVLLNAPKQPGGYINIGKNFTVATNPDVVTWNENAASVAYALLQQPVKLNVHAEGLIPKP